MTSKLIQQMIPLLLLSLVSELLLGSMEKKPPVVKPACAVFAPLVAGIGKAKVLHNSTVDIDRDFRHSKSVIASDGLDFLENLFESRQHNLAERLIIMSESTKSNKVVDFGDGIYAKFDQKKREILLTVDYKVFAFKDKRKLQDDHRKGFPGFAETERILINELSFFRELPDIGYNLKFINSVFSQNHYRKHGEDLGLKSESEYVVSANNLLDSFARSNDPYRYIGYITPRGGDHVLVAVDMYENKLVVMGTMRGSSGLLSFHKLRADDNLLSLIWSSRGIKSKKNR